MRNSLKAYALAIALLTTAAPVFASHLIKVVEIFPGTGAAPTAEYVVLQMYADAQNQVAGHSLTLFNGAGTLTGTVTLPANLAHGTSQARILIATRTAESFFGIKADIAVGPCSSVVYFSCVPWVFDAGKVCWNGTADCVAWGPYHGSLANVGKPFDVITGIRTGRAAIRRRDIAGSPNVLDAGDDTGNSASDFILGLPAPRNNAGAIGAAPSATCANGLYEGLEECDDDNLAAGDGCSKICKVEGPMSITGDFDDEGTSDLLWRNPSTGADLLWRTADASAVLPVSAVSQSWHVVGKGDFDGNRSADLFWRNASTGQNMIWRSANAGNVQAVATVIDLRWKVQGIGDFDADGQADVFWRNTGTGQNIIWRSANTLVRQAVTTVSNQAWQVVGVGDFDHDGKADLLWRNSSTGANSIWRSGNAATPRTTAALSDLAWKMAGIGDFNADAHADILWRNRRTGANMIWKSAVSTTQQAIAGMTDQAWQVAAVGDYDNDGTSDVLWRNTSTGANMLWKSANAATQKAVAGVGVAWTIVPP